MRANVFTDQALMKHAGQFAWLAVDIDKPENAAYLEKHPTIGVPTFRVVDPATETTVIEWAGNLTVPELLKFLEAGRRSLEGPGKGAGAALAKADRLQGQRQFAEAAKAYREALTQGGPSWSERPRAVSSLVASLFSANQYDACVDSALQELLALPRGQAFAVTVSWALACATSDAGAKNGKLKAILPQAEECLRLPGVLADDRAEIYSVLISVKQQEKDEEAARRLARDGLEFLEKELAQAQSAEARLALGSYLLRFAGPIGAVDRILPALEASEHDLPGDYVPAQRLAAAYQRVGRTGDALAANERAIEKASGFAKLNQYQMRVSMLESKGDKAAARQAVEDALQYASTLPQTKQVERRTAFLKKKLDGTR